MWETIDANSWVYFNPEVFRILWKLVFSNCALRSPSIFFLVVYLIDHRSISYSFFFCNQCIWVVMATRASKLTLVIVVINYILLWQNTSFYNKHIWILGLKLWGLIDLAWQNSNFNELYCKGELLMLAV